MIVSDSVGARIDFIRQHCLTPTTGKPIDLLPFQIEFIESTFADGVLSAGLSIPRGNGKTSLLACIALSELFCNPYAPDVACAGVTLQQSARPAGVYGVAKSMVLTNPVLLEQVRIHRNNNDPHIELKARPGQIACIAAKDPDGLLGGAWSMAIVDEFGSDFWTDERWGNIVQSCGKRGTSSRVIGISTPNSPRSAMFSLRQRYMAGNASKYLHWTEYAAPEDTPIDDVESWHTANPALGHFLDINALHMDVVDQPAWLFRIMRLGQWFEMTDDGWLGVDGANNWDFTTTEIEFDPDEEVFIGVDKAAYNDCAAVVALQRDGDRWLAKSKVFEPKPVIDHIEVKAYIRELCRNFRNVAAIGFDDRFFVEGAQELEDEGLPMVRVTQASAYMSPAYSELQRAITSKSFWHENDPVYRSHVLSAVLSNKSDNEGIMLSKRKSRYKIDAVVATALAIAVSGYTSRHEYRIYY